VELSARTRPNGADKKNQTQSKSGILSEMTTARVCRECSRSLPLDREHFNVNGFSPNGQQRYRHICKECYRVKINSDAASRKVRVTCSVCGGECRADRLRIPEDGYRCFKCACRANSKYDNANLRWYHCWYTMHRRCDDKLDPTYGGRGIAVCDDWKDYSVFAKWAESVGLGDNRTTLDRIDPDGGYSPDNCRPADMATQVMNRRSQHLQLVILRRPSMAERSGRS